MDKLPLQESESVELKKSLAELKQGLVSIAAILNKNNAGTLWFGVRNAGAVIGNLTIDDLRKGNVSQRRNPLIANLFRRIEMVEAWGRGMPLILRYAPDVVFREIGNLFIVAFHRPSFLEQKDAGEAATQEKIITSLRAEPTLTRKLLAQRLGISEDGVKYHLNKLKTAGRIRHVGPTKAGRWDVIEGRIGTSNTIKDGSEDE